MVPEIKKVGPRVKLSYSNVQGIHDNPVSGNCQTLSHWKNSEDKNTYLTQEGRVDWE